MDASLQATLDQMIQTFNTIYFARARAKAQLDLAELQYNNKVAQRESASSSLWSEFRSLVSDHGLDANAVVGGVLISGLHNFIPSASGNGLGPEIPMSYIFTPLETINTIEEFHEYQKNAVLGEPGYVYGLFGGGHSDWTNEQKIENFEQQWASSPYSKEGFKLLLDFIVSKRGLWMPLRAEERTLWVAYHQKLFAYMEQNAAFEANKNAMAEFLAANAANGAPTLQQILDQAEAAWQAYLNPPPPPVPEPIPVVATVQADIPVIQELPPVSIPVPEPKKSPWLKWAAAAVGVGLLMKGE